MLQAVLPHEVTHVVLAGNFGEQPVPRWADEGIAVLTEPRNKVEEHLRNLPKHLSDRQLMSLEELVRMSDYPKEGRLMGPFYAQSVSLVDFLAAQKGPRVFVQFVREGMKTGYEQALPRHYGFQSFAELEQSWRQHAFRNADAGTGLAQARP
jgi:hypothetical protein